MNKKSYLRAFLLACMGGVLGVFISIFLRKFDEGSLDLGKFIESLMMNNLHFFMIGLIVLILVPALCFLSKGRRIMMTLEEANDDDFSDIEQRGKKALDMALSFNMAFMILNFMTFGIGFSREMPLSVMLISVFIFFVTMTATTIIEFRAIKLIQTYDSRLKGDPSKFNFHKEYLNSCDEAEKYQIYKAAYKAFQFTKIIGMVLLLVAVLGNMLLDTGIMPVVLTGTMLLALIGSYSGHAMMKQV
ncbi:DUF3169 family protein [Acidaminobacter sp. JC074]|uniref:DUF3169 family protein n=1 Tax=Acidaminobacter sp. JC074 TaxID=2530199 RepID=UPI001F0E914A|nr:DUF3169 family protein [Acidaminobacter sp. JC074]